MSEKLVIMERDSILNEYRISECIQSGDEMYKIFLSKEQGCTRCPDKDCYNVFKNTLLWHFAQTLYRHNIKGSIFEMPKYSRIDIVINIIKNILNDKKYSDLPDRDTLVIHLRLGDVCGDNYKHAFNKWNDIAYIGKHINDSKKTKIVIVAGCHLGIWRSRELDSISIERSKNFLDSFIRMIPEKFEVSVKSSRDIDEDFIYMCCAHELLLSGCSGYGKLALHINGKLKAL
jgi:hypothetical protein